MRKTISRSGRRRTVRGRTQAVPGIKNTAVTAGYIILLLLCFALQQPVQAQFAGGEGTEQAPWQVTNWAELNELRNYLGISNRDKHFQLMNDLDSLVDGYDSLVADDGTLAHGGKGWRAIGFSISGAFSGTLDGRGFSISDIRIRETDPLKTGLFGCLEDSGEVKNLSITRCFVKADYYVAGLVADNYGTIYNCSFHGQIEGNSNVGGLVGYNQDGGLVTCCHSSGSVQGIGQWIGGLVGYNDDGATISNSYSSASVSGWASAGGLVGSNSGAVQRCYSKGPVSGSMRLGALIGYEGGGEYESCFCLGTAESAVGSRTEPPLGIVAKTSDQLKSVSTFTDWDFESVWDSDVEANDSYPFLREDPRGPVPTVNRSKPLYQIRKTSPAFSIRTYDNQLIFSSSVPIGTPFTLINLSGQKILSGTVKGNAVHTGALAEKMYFLKTTDRDGVQYNKVVVID